MKKCKTCECTKVESEFYPLPRMKDGLTSECKDCVKKRVSERRDRLYKTDKVWLEQERERCRKKQEAYRKSGREKKSPIWVNRNWRKRNKLKVEAQQEARRLLISGKIKRQKICSDCGATDVRLEMHHPDYSRPQFIVWLCCKCHGKTKRKAA